MGDAPEQHLKYSPSSAYRWSVCPHSVNVDTGPGESSKATDDGNNVHAFAAGVLNNAAQNLGKMKPKDIANANIYISHVRENEADEMYVEHFWQSILMPDFGGTTDCTLFSGDACAVYDYKNGRWPVQAIGNKQLLSYATVIAELRPDITEFYGVIVQPNSSDKQVVKPTARFDLAAIDDFRGVVEWARQSDDVVAGDHCRFCPLRKAGQCKEGAKMAKAKGW